MVIRNGLFLILTISLFRLEKMLLLGVPLSPASWLLAIEPEIGTVLVFELLWLFFAIAVNPHSKTWWVKCFYASHLILYLVAIIEHQFFLKTGTQIDLSLLCYAILHANEIASIIHSGIDGSLIVRGVIATCCFGLGICHSPPICLSQKTILCFVTLALILSPLSLRLVLPHAPALPFSTTLYLDFFLPWKRDSVASITHPVSPKPMYHPPAITDSAPIQHPNILLLILESTGATMLPPYRTIPTVHTPFFSRLSQESVVIESAYTTVSHTSKALVGILCGMFPQLTQSIIEATSSPFPLACLPTLLNTIGYRTAFFQTATGTFENRPRLLENLGFQSWKVQEDYSGDFKKIGYFGMDEFAMINPALTWIRHNRHMPFFITLLTVTTHHPYQTPEMPAWPKAGEELQAYLKAVEHVDQFAEAVFLELENTGLLENTLFIIVGDHGEAFGEHMRWQHDVVPYEEVMHVPLYLYGRQFVGPPRHVTGLRSHIDILPTVLDILHVSWNGMLPGTNLLTTGGHPFVVSSCWYADFCLTLRMNRLKFIYHYGRQRPEIFDLVIDPDETNNQIGTIPQYIQAEAWTNLLTLKNSIDLFYRRQISESMTITGYID